MKENKKRGIFKPLGAFLLALVMVLTHVMGVVEVHAKADVKKPTIKPVSIGDTVITGSGLIGAGQRKAKNAGCKIIVTVKDAGGVEIESKEFSIGPTERASNWSVTLTNPVQNGYKVYAKQEFNGGTSEDAFVEVKPSLASQYENKLTMPTLEVWSEDLSVIEADAVDDIVSAFKEENNALTPIDDKNFEENATAIKVAGNGKSIDVTFSDKSTLKIDISDKVTVKEITEVSNPPIIDPLKVVDGKISGKISGDGPFTRAKVKIVSFGSGKKTDGFCTEKGCSIDKNASVLAELTVDEQTGAFSYDIDNSKLELGKDFGVIVKEYRKKNNCSTIQPELVIPEKTEVKDPRKLTKEDKKAIDTAIREVNKVNGTSKLPNGTGDWNGVPAVIQIDDSGNAKIFKGNDVKGTWDQNNDYKFVPEKNEDGSVKLKDEAKPTATIPAKDLLKNIKPDAPAVKLSDDKKSITIIPNTLDTDAETITVSYTGTDGKPKTTTAKKGDTGWTINSGEGSVDKDTGVITLPADKVKGGTDVTAKVTDKGGIADDDQDPLTSEPGTLTVKETIADKVKALGGLDPVDLKKWVDDPVDWKDGVKAKDSTKETEVNNLLTGATFTDVTEENRNTSKEGDFEGKIKITFDDKSELVVEKQMLYVSNHVTSVERKDKVPTDALDVEFKLGEGTKVNNVGSGAVEGNKATPTLYQKYKVKPGTNLKMYQVPVLNSSVVDSIKLSEQEGYVDSTWNTEDFTATTSNKVFTATAIKAFNVTLEANGGEGTMKGTQVKENGTYKLPENSFTPPENKEFAGWLVGDATTTTDPGTEITITGDTVIKASWKPIELKVKFKTEAGASGTMEDKAVNKGSKYELPTPTFKPEEGKEFAGWKVGDGTELKQAGDQIDISGDVTLTATWKDIEYKVTFDGTEGKGTMAEKLVKKGEGYTLPENGFEAPDNKVFDGWLVGTEKKSVGDKIIVNGNTEVKAVWKPIMVDVSFDKGEGSGNKDKVSVAKGSEYTLPDSEGFTPPANQVFAGWQVGNETKNVGEKITVNENTTVTAKYTPIMVNVSFDKGEGSGNKDKVSVAKGSEYTLPDGKDFTPPENQKFAGWEVNGKTKNVGDKITVNENTKVTAKYTPITVDVSFDKGEGSGNKDKVSVAKGSEYTLPDSEGFTPPANQEFAGWEVDGVAKKVGDKITVNENTTVTAKWKAKEKPEDPSKPKPSDPKKPSAPAITWRGLWYLGEKTEPAKAVQEMEIGRHYKYLYGYVDKTVRPEGMITRSEAAALIARLAELDMTDKTKPNFKDTPSAWYNSAINIMVKKDLMFGDKNGNFRPNEPITRGEFARALYYIDKKNDKVAPFADVKGHEFEAAINQAYGNDRIAGYPDGSFKPNAYIQRAEAARILNQYANRNVNIPGMEGVKKDLIRFTDINENHWAYCEVMEAANSHEYQREKGSQVETWLRILDIKADWE